MIKIYSKDDLERIEGGFYKGKLFSIGAFSKFNDLIFFCCYTPYKPNNFLLLDFSENWITEDDSAIEKLTKYVMKQLNESDRERLIFDYASF